MIFHNVINVPLIIKRFKFICWCSFFTFCRLSTSGPKCLWGDPRWMFFWVWVFPSSPIIRGLVQRCPSTVGAARWTNVPAPFTSDAPVFGPHQSDGNRNLDLSAHPRVRFLTIFCEADGYHLQGIPHLHSQYIIKGGDKGLKISTSMEAGLKVHFFCPLCLLKTLHRWLC